jgi:iron complex outermembrane recepter protein
MASFTQTICVRASLKRSPRALRLLFALTPLSLAISAIEAQTIQRTDPITVSARSAPVLDSETADVGGFAAALGSTPQSITVFSNDLLAVNQIKMLSTALKLDASLSDNYNANGYIESLSVRGFTLDQANNFRRNGLATSNYAPLAFENKERIEILKGISGLQSGVSAPGGLVNFVTKKPLREAFTQLNLSADEYGGAGAHVDTNARLGAAGIRLNVAAEKLRTQFDRADGSRAFASGALALPLSNATALAAEFEFHRKSQPSVPGLGLLDIDGDGVAETLPRVLPTLNLNNQSWSLPVQSRTTQVSAALTRNLAEDWRASVSFAHFASKLNDRVAFPDGCGNASNFVYPGLCGNGDVDIYDFRSDNEQRKLSSWEAKLDTKLGAFSATHHAQVSLSGRIGSTRMPPKSAYNYAGFTNIFAPRIVQENPALDAINTQSSERSTEAAVTLQSTWNTSLRSFAGIRVARYKRESIRSDGTERAALNQTISTPWFGTTINMHPALTTYASWGMGVELENVPNRPDIFQNFGAALTGLTSKQFELGAKWQITERALATLAVFQIEKPYADDIENANGLRTRIAGGKRARHRGLEVSTTGQLTRQLSIQASAMYLDARYVQGLTATLVDQRVTNVPRLAASLFADYKIAAVNGLSVNSLVWTQRAKNATVGGNVVLPNAWQLDFGASYQTRIGRSLVTTRLHVENLTNRAYWREAPSTSWGGTYLFASKPRTVKLSASLDF